MRDEHPIGRKVIPLEPPSLLTTPQSKDEWTRVATVQHELAQRGKHWLYEDQTSVLAAYCQLLDQHEPAHAVRHGLLLKYALALGLLDDRFETSDGRFATGSFKYPDVIADAGGSVKVNR